jgi:hypothetical protein
MRAHGQLPLLPLFAVLLLIGAAFAQYTPGPYCLNVNGTSTFCGTLPPKMCALYPSRPVQGYQLNQDDFNYVTSAAYREEVCPLNPSSVPQVFSQTDYCAQGSCLNDADCAWLSRPMCYDYCMYCFGDAGWCNHQVDSGEVASAGDTFCWTGDIVRVEVGGSSSSSSNGNAPTSLYVWIILAVVGGSLVLVLLIALGVVAWKKLRHRTMLILGDRSGSSSEPSTAPSASASSIDPTLVNGSCPESRGDDDEEEMEELSLTIPEGYEAELEDDEEPEIRVSKKGGVRVNFS